MNLYTPSNRQSQGAVRITICALAVILGLLSAPARGATFTWDAVKTGTGSDGSGTWSTSGTNWASGGSDSTWSNSDNTDIAVLGTGGTAGTLTVSGGVSVGGITFNPTGGGAYTVTSSTVTMTGSNIVVNASGATINSNVAGTAGLAVSGAGALSLGGVNTYSGGTDISSGILILNTTTAAGSGAINLNDSSTGSNNTTLQLGVNVGTWANPITVSNQGSGTTNIKYTQNGGGSGGAVTTGTITLNGPATFSAPSITGYMFLDSVLSGTGALTIGATNNNRLILNSASSDTGFTGDVIVSSGAVFEPRAELSATNGNNVTVQSGGYLQLFGGANINGLNGSGNVEAFTAGATLTVGEGNGSGSFGGTLYNNGAVLALVKIGAGTQIITGTSNTYTGGTTISGGVLQLGDGMSNNGSVSGNITDNATLAFANPLTQSFAGVISGSGGVTASGPAMLTLTGANSYSGATTIGAGGLTLGGAGTLGSGNYAGNITNGGGFTYGSSASQTLSGMISGTGSLTVSGSGTLALSGSNSYGGGTDISHGTLALNGVYSSGTGTINLDDSNTGSQNATLQLGVPGGTYANAITVTNSSSGTTTIQYTPGSSSTTVTTGTITLNGPATISAPSITGYLFLNSVLSGSGALTIGNTGNDNRLILNQASPGFTGNITIASGGLLEPRADLSASNGNNVTVQSGGYLQLFGSANINGLNGSGNVEAFTAGATLTVGEGNGSGSFGGTLFNNGAVLALAKIGTGTQIITGTNNTYTGGTTISGGVLQLGDGVSNNGSLPGNITDNATLAFANPLAQSFAGVISGSGGVTASGPGTLTLAAANTYSGATTIGTGTRLTVGSAGSLGSAGTYAGNIADAGNLTYNSSASDILNGAISGTGSLTVAASAGTLTLGGSNSFSGGTVLSSGTVLLSNNSAAGTGNITLNDSNTGSQNTTLLLGIGGVAVTWGNAITVANQGSGTATIEYTPPSNSFSFTTGTMTLNGSATFSAPTLTGYMLFQSVLTGTGALTIGSTDGQRLILQTGESSFTGNIAISNNGLLEPRSFLSAANGNNVTVQSGGILQLFGGASISALNGAGTVRGFLAGGTLTIGEGNASGTFSGIIIDNGVAIGLTKVGSGTETLTGTSSAYSGGTTISGGTLQLGNGVSNNGAVTGNIADNATLAFANPLAQTYSGAISGSGTVTVSGPGALTLTGGSTYTGPTNVTGGTLIVAGSLSGSQVNVAGSTLAGVGEVVGNVIVGTGSGAASSSIIAPSAGGGAASLSQLYVAGNLMLNSDAAFKFGLDSSNSGYTDSLLVTGTLNLAESPTLTGFDISSGVSPSNIGNTYEVASASNIIGTFSNAPATGDTLLIGIDTYTIDYTGSQIDLTLTAVPEPGTWATILLGFGTLAGLQRRRGRAGDRLRHSRS